MFPDLPVAYASQTLFEGEDDEYAQILEAYPITHYESMEILRFAARLKKLGFSSDTIIERMITNLSR